MFQDELTTLSEKLECISKDEEGDGDDSTLSEESSPDSGWNSGTNTPSVSSQSLSTTQSLRKSF